MGKLGWSSRASAAPSSPQLFPSALHVSSTHSKLSGLAVFALLSGAAHAQAQEVRACWLTQYTYLTQSESGLRAIAQNIRAGGMNTVYFNVYGGGGLTYWPSKAFQAAGGSWGHPSFDWSRHLVRIFHEEGLEVGAWFEYGLALSSSTHPVAVAHPDWLARDQSGSAVTGENGGFVFLSPSHPSVIALMRDMVRELAENYDFDDIQVDRIRWGRRTTGREYGYEASTVAAYQAQFGVSPPTNVNNSTWVTFREGLVNNVVQQCYQTIKQANPKLVVSSAPVGSYGWTQHMQRWNQWVAGGYLDLVIPQMYMTSLSSFQTEFNAQKNAAGANVAKLAVGYRAQETNDWSLVRDQLNYARSQGVPHGCLWVYHNYSGPIAIQDEINNLPDPGQPWNAPAVNPFVAPDSHTIVVDNADPVTSATLYAEAGPGWTNSAQPDFFQFNSRVAPGGAISTAEFQAALPRTGAYDVYSWHTASSNRNPAARYDVHHAGGVTSVNVDQRTNGGRWVLLGRYFFSAGPLARRVLVSNQGSSAAEFTSADGVRLVYRDEAVYYCTAKVNSLGCTPQLDVTGTTSLSGADDLHVLATNVVNNKSGLFFFGAVPHSAPFGGGTLCVQSPVQRAPAIDSGGAASGSSCTGVYDQFLSHAFLASKGLSAGSPLYGQVWSRDPQHPDGSTIGLTGGVHLVLLP